MATCGGGSVGSGVVDRHTASHPVARLDDGGGGGDGDVDGNPGCSSVRESGISYSHHHPTCQRSGPS